MRVDRDVGGRGYYLYLYMSTVCPLFSTKFNIVND